MVEELAIIRNVKIGMGDRGEPVLSFQCSQEDYAADQYLSWTRAGELFKETGFGSVQQFDGKPCIVRKDGAGGMSNTMIFVRMAKV